MPQQRGTAIQIQATVSVMVFMGSGFKSVFDVVFRINRSNQEIGDQADQ